MGLNERIGRIDKAIFGYTESIKEAKEEKEIKNYEGLIILLNNQKIKIRQFQAEIEEVI